MIGRGVSFLYSFPLEKIYTVFLDVTSDSKNRNGKTDVLPLRLRTDINVLPRLANISFYLNGINVTNLNELKVSVVEGMWEDAGTFDSLLAANNYWAQKHRDSLK